MENKGATFTYKQIGGFEFAQVIQKISSTPTNNKAANHIRHIVKEAQEARNQLSNEYKSDIMEKYFQKDEKGEAIISKDTQEPQLIVPEGSTLEAATEELMKATAEFEKRTVVIKWRPLTPTTLSDIKLSAKDLETLGELFTDQEGPGIPDFGNVQAIR